MVYDVPGDYVSQCSDGEGIVAGYTCPRPRVLGQILEKGNRSSPNVAKLLYMICPGNIVRPAAGHTDLLIETWQRIRKTPSEPECPIQENAFAIVYVI